LHGAAFFVIPCRHYLLPCRYYLLRSRHSERSEEPPRRPPPPAAARGKGQVGCEEVPRCARNDGRDDNSVMLKFYNSKF
jgi:hypothetical protein